MFKRNTLKCGSCILTLVFPYVGLTKFLMLLLIFSVNQYMAFGLSGRSDSTFMVGADATIAWVDSDTGSPNAEDYYITGQFQVGAVHLCHFIAQIQ